MFFLVNLRLRVGGMNTQSEEGYSALGALSDGSPEIPHGSLVARSLDGILSTTGAYSRITPWNQISTHPIVMSIGSLIWPRLSRRPHSFAGYECSE